MLLQDSICWALLNMLIMKVLVIGGMNVITGHADRSQIELYDQHACIEIDSERR